MFMSRITISPMASLRDVEVAASGDSYSDHRLVWSFFSREIAERSFLYRRVESRGRPFFLVVSGEAPVSELPSWIVETKAYEPRLTVGQALSFSLRANPVVRRRTDDGRHRRDDVVMDAKKRQRQEGLNKELSLAELTQKAGSAWLETRAERLGFLLEYVQCDGYRQHRIMRRGGVIAFSSLDLNGLLRVKDPKRLAQTLYKGVGPSKAFGCGLFLLKRV